MFRWLLLFWLFLTGSACLDEPFSRSDFSSKEISHQSDQCLQLSHQYDGLIEANRQCKTYQECKVFRGHCGIGIGSCYFAAHESFKLESLEQIVTELHKNDCGTAVCKCAREPKVICDKNNRCDFETTRMVQ